LGGAVGLSYRNLLFGSGGRVRRSQRRALDPGGRPESRRQGGRERHRHGHHDTRFGRVNERPRALALPVLPRLRRS